jgi:hypothetical protein
MEKKSGQEGGRCHMEDGTLHTTVKRIGREFIKIYAIISYGEGIKGLRETGLHFHVSITARIAY